MYALYYEHADGRREWLQGADDEQQAQNLARLWSRYAETPVLVIRNLDGGGTTLVCTFRAGQPDTTLPH